MKKIIVAILFWAFCIVGGCVTGALCQSNETLYPLTTRVVEVDEEADLVTCEDFNGNLWEFEGCEDWQDGDICSLLMNDKGTEEIFDDEIILMHYDGTFEGWN